MTLLQFDQMFLIVPELEWSRFIYPNMINPSSPAKTAFHAELCNPITRQAIELESCSNPLRIQQVL